MWEKRQEAFASHDALIWIKILTTFKFESVNVKAVILRNCMSAHRNDNYWHVEPFIVLF